MTGGCDDYFMLRSSRRFEDLPIFSWQYCSQGFLAPLVPIISQVLRQKPISPASIAIFLTFFFDKLRSNKVCVIFHIQVFILDLKSFPISFSLFEFEYDGLSFNRLLVRYVYRIRNWDHELSLVVSY